ncbi:MAG TPA: radical SAM family heme chaperone HemW [Holophaga sp.]|nr:radical SAM family heme chaperone HemW [Holophaga sp.]
MSELPDTQAEALREAAGKEPLGLYLHVPFCRDKCSYCSFVSTRDDASRTAVFARLAGELEDWGGRLGRPAVDTLYLGGGTPSLLTEGELADLTEAVHRAFRTTGLLEATLEANPGTIAPGWLAAARRLGWDRISLGVQTLDDGLLRRLGRVHDARDGLAALRQAREAGFERVSADLLLGIPGQDFSRVPDDAAALVAAGASHLSIYMLDLDKPCLLKAQVDRGELVLPSDDALADAFEALQDVLPRHGLFPYEISNYAAPGEASRHNTRYWERRPYLGLGPSAASHLGRWRWTACDGIQAWLGGAGPAERQELDPSAELAEIPLLGLRMLRGVDWQALRAKAEAEGLLGLVDQWETGLAPFFRHGLLAREGPVLRFTRKGLLLSNAVLELFV